MCGGVGGVPGGTSGSLLCVASVGSLDAETSTAANVGGRHTKSSLMTYSFPHIGAT